MAKRLPSFAKDLGQKIIAPSVAARGQQFPAFVSSALCFGGFTAPTILRILLLAALASVSLAQADLRVEADRSQVRVNESLNLKIISDKSSPDQIDLSSLPTQFEIISRSTRQNIQIINGRRSASYELSLSLIALETGTVQIPSLELEGDRSQALTIEIAPEAAGSAKVAEVELSSPLSSAYVFQEIPLTLKLRFTGELAQGQLSDLSVDQAQIELLDESRYRSGNGEIVERKYVLYPQSAGSLSIPAVRFQGTMRANSRLGLSGRVVRSSSNPLTIDILPPAAGELSEWLPASAVRLNEQLQPATTQLQLGTPITRTITLEATGMLGANLPEIALDPSSSDLRQYRDQSQFSNSKGRTNMIGRRIENIVYIPQSAGPMTLPEVVVPWWDVGADAMAYARLPARDLVIVPDPAASSASVAVAPVSSVDEVVVEAPEPSISAWEYWSNNYLLHTLAALLALSLISNVLLLIRRNRARSVASIKETKPSANSSAYLSLCSAIAERDPVSLSSAWQRWRRQLHRNHPHWQSALAEGELRNLNEIFSANEQLAWSREQKHKPDYATLLKICQKLNKVLSKNKALVAHNPARHLRSLYPET